MLKFSARITALSLVAILTFGLTACSLPSSAKNTKQSASSSSSKKSTNNNGTNRNSAFPGAPGGSNNNGGSSKTFDQTTVFGKVTAIDGTKVTLALGKLSNPRPSADEKPQLVPGKGGFQRVLTLSGETKTINIANVKILKKSAPAPQQNGAPQKQPADGAQRQFNQNTEAATPDDIKQGAVIQVVYQKSTNAILSATILEDVQIGEAQAGGAIQGAPQGNPPAPAAPKQ